MAVPPIPGPGAAGSPPGGERNRTADDALFGKTLVREGVLSPQQLQSAVQAQQTMRGQGVNLRLGEVLVSQKILTPEQVKQFLHLAGKQLLHCPKCGKNYNVKNWKPGREVFCPSCSVALVPPPSDKTLDATDTQHLPAVGAAGDVRDQAGKPFGRYRLLEELGHGGMGVVWKAWDTQLKRIVALKQILAGGEIDAGQVERFMREAQLAAKLAHPHIVPVHDVGVHEGQHFFTTEYIAGQPLDQVMKKPVPVKQALGWVKAVAEALAYAHEQGVVHRDVKPANILIDGKGQPHVMDFGLAKDVELGSQSGGKGPALTISGALMGTPQYMSPEQASAGTAALGAATDQFSLGVVLYELLTRRVPFRGGSLRELLNAITEREPVRPTRANSRIHRDVETICLKALEKTPARRYASMADFAADVGRYLDGEPIVARPASMVYRIGKKLTKHKGMAALAAALVLALVGGLVTWRVTENQADARVAEAKQEVEKVFRDVRSTDLYRRADQMLVKGLMAQRYGDTGPLEKGVAEVHGLAKASLIEDPAKPEPHFVEAWALRLEGCFEAAIAEYTEYLKQRPDDAVAHYERGLCGMALYSREHEAALQSWSDMRRNRIQERLAASGNTGGEGTSSPLLADRSRRIVDPVPDATEADLAALRPQMKLYLSAAESDFDLLMGDALQTQTLSASALGHRRMAKGEFAAAAVVFDLMFKASGPETLPEALVGLADSNHRLWSKGEMPYEAALAVVTEAQKANRGLDRTHLALALMRADRASSLFYREKRTEEALALWKEAEEEATRAVQLWPHRAEECSRRSKLRESWGEALASRGDGEARTKLIGAVEDGEQALSRSPEGVEAQYELAKVQVTLGNWEGSHGQDPTKAYHGAIQAYLSEISKNPTMAWAYNELASARFDLGQWNASHGKDPTNDYKEAIAGFATAISNGFGFPWPFAGRAAAQTRLGDWKASHGEDPTGEYEGAIADCDAALSKNPKYLDALGERALAKLSLADWKTSQGGDPTKELEGAIADFGTAHSESPEGCNNRGVALFKLAQWKTMHGEDSRRHCEAAIAECDTALSKNPELVQVYNNRANARSELGVWMAAHGEDPTKDYEESIRDYGTALSKNPEYAAGYNNRGGTLLRLANFKASQGKDPTKEIDGAIADYGSALSKNPELVEAYNARAGARCVLGALKSLRGEDPSKEFEAAICDCEAALERNPASWQACLGLALVHEAMAEYFEGAGSGAKDASANAKENRRDAVKCYETAWEMSQDPRVKPLLDAAKEKVRD